MVAVVAGTSTEVRKILVSECWNCPRIRSFFASSLDDYDDRIGREVYETPESRLKTSIIKFGEVVSKQKCSMLSRFV